MNVARSGSVIALVLLCLCVLVFFGAPGQANSPPARPVVTGEGVCVPQSLTSIPVANFRPPVKEPLSPWDVTQIFNASKEDPSHWVETKKDGTKVHHLGHNGLDLRGAKGGAHNNEEEIRAAFDGVVVATSAQTISPTWGIAVAVVSRVSEYSDELITTHYHHFAERYVEVTNDTEVCPRVDVTELIGREGRTGTGTAVHLHFTTRYWANLEHLEQWLRAGNNGENGRYLWGRAYPGYNSERHRGKRDPFPADEFDPGSPFYDYGYLSPEPLIKDYFNDFRVPHPPHDWAEEYADKMRHYGISLGRWDGFFGVQDTVKRREAARWLKIAIGPAFDGEQPQGQLFSDVPLSDPDLPYIQALTTYPKTTESPLIDPDGIFNPNDSLNKAEAIKMVVLAAYPEEYQVFLKWWNDHVDDEYFYHDLDDYWLGELWTFSDVDKYDWFASYVYFGAIKQWYDGGWFDEPFPYEVGLVELGINNTLFHPDQEVERSHMAKWVVTVAERLSTGPLYDPCAPVECPYDQFCDPITQTCVEVEDCIPHPEEPCEQGGGGGVPETCMDGFCDPGEDCLSCPEDCGPCPPECGDAMCNGMEDCETCPEDCGECPPGCPDEICGPDESCEICPQDCGPCVPECGDNECNGDEDCDSCPGDCGQCPPECGDNQCNGNETCNSCPGDCGDCGPMCGDNACEGNEDCNLCPEDCGNCVCADNEIDEDACDPGTYCPPGTRERVCANDSWGPWGSCESNLGLKFHGDGGKHCGPVVCLQISGNGNDSTLSATLSKTDNGIFANDVSLVMFQPSSNDVVQYGCVSTSGLTSYNFQISVNNFDISLGGTALVNAQAASPCVNGANYISEDASISQCSSN